MKVATLYTLTPEAGGQVIESNLSGKNEVSAAETAISKSITVEKTDSNSKTLPQQKTSQNSMNEGSNTPSGPCNRSGKSENVDLSDIGLALFLFLFSSRRAVQIRDI